MTCWVFLVFLACIVCAFATSASAGEPGAWETIRSSFRPPPEYADQFGPYRSPLKFDDGSDVKTPADWEGRRAEILRKWHALMGPWPEPLANPAIEVVETTRRESFTQHKVRVTIAADRMLDGYLLVPDTATKQQPAPAVLVPFYDAETGANLPGSRVNALESLTFRAYGYHLARRGFVALSIGSPGGDARVPDLAGNTLQPLSYLAYIAHNCAGALAARPEVDAERIGVVGHSYGGKWALSASCLSDRFAAAVWSDPGIVFDEARANVNYWEPWYLGLDPALPAQRKPGVVTPENGRTGPYERMMESGTDLHELHALMAPRPFLVSAGSEDPPERWIALNHTVAVNRLLGHDDRVGMHNRSTHGPNEEANDVVYAFFEHFLKNGAHRPASRAAN
jgi:dienelactone hydrolase